MVLQKLGEDLNSIMILFGQKNFLYNNFQSHLNSIMILLILLDILAYDMHVDI